VGLRTEVIHYAAKWVLAGALAIPVGTLWYISTLPALAREIFMGSAPAVTIFAGLSLFFSGLVVLFTYIGAYRNPRHFSLTFAFLIAVLALCSTGVTEWVREAVRKPYIIYGYMYANNLRPDQIAQVRQQGILKSALWVRVHEVDPQVPELAGEEVFRVDCASCHTLDGYNGIRFAVKGWGPAMIDYQLSHLNQLKRFMPPFAGTEEERQALGAWLVSLSPPPPNLEISPEEKAQTPPLSPQGASRP
jgi:mono/diheme cytochrome c family protein